MTEKTKNINFIIECLKNNKTIIFVKYGDGEYQCANLYKGANCDGDRYFPELGEKIKKSFIYLSSHENILIGKWSTYTVFNFFENLLHIKNKKINWINYNTLINNDKFNQNDDLYRFVKTIQECNRNKIIVSNKMNIKMKKIFNADIFIEIPSKCWSLKYDYFFSKIMESLKDNSIVITSAGLCSKVLIADLVKKNKTISCLDTGSSFDLLCGRNTRGWKHSYEDEYNYYKNILPDDW